MSSRHNVRAHFWQSCANYSQQFSGLFLGIFLARLLTPADFGTFAYIGAIVGLGLLPVSWSVAGQIIPERHENPDIIADALHFAWRWLPLRILIAFLLSLLIGMTMGRDAFFIALILSTPLALSDFVSIPRALLESQGRFEINFLDSALTFLLVGIPAIFFAYLGAGVWALVLPTLPLFIIQCFVFSKFAGIRLLPPINFSAKTYWKSIWSLWFFNAGEMILLRIDKFLLGKTSSIPEVGDYNRALNYGPVSARLLNSLVSNPTVAALAKNPDKSARAKLVFKSGFLLVFGGAINFAVLFWLSKDLVPVIFGEQWRNAIPVFEAVAPMSLVLAIANLPFAIALSKQMYSEIALSRFGGVVVFLVSCLFFYHEMTPVIMAILLQIAILFQLPILLITMKMRRFFLS